MRSEELERERYEQEKKKEKERRNESELYFFSKWRGSMTWSYFRAIRLNGRLGFELLHPVQYPRYCTGCESKKWYNFVSQFTTWRVIIGEDVLPHGPQTLFTSHNSPMWWFVIQNYAIFYGPNTTHKENMALLWLDAFNGMRVEMFLLSNEKKKEVFKKN